MSAGKKVLNEYGFYADPAPPENDTKDVVTEHGAAVVTTEARYGAHPDQFVRVHAPAFLDDDPLPCLIVVHGGFWKDKYTVDNAAHETVAPFAAARGWIGVEVEYRRRDGGGCWPHGVDDVKKAIKAAAGLQRVDAAQVVVLGHSAGGHAALMAAAADGVPAPALVVAVAPVADLVACWKRRLSDEGDAIEVYMGGRTPALDPEAYEAACPTRWALPRLRARKVPLLVVTGDADDDVPPDLSRKFSADAKAELLEVAGDHYTPMDAAGAAFGELWERIQTAVRVPHLLRKAAKLGYPRAQEALDVLQRRNDPDEEEPMPSFLSQQQLEECLEAEKAQAKKDDEAAEREKEMQRGIRRK